MRFADLHLHTTFSDGTTAPQQLVAESIKAGLAAVAVVDHDTVEGIAPCIAAAAGIDLEIVPGIEFSVEHEGLEIHILGYYIDHQNAELVEKLAVLKQNRIERVRAMCRKLNELAMCIEPEEVFALAHEGTVGRLHVARVLLKHGYVGSTGEAFQRFIGDKGPAFVLGFRFSPADAISLIKRCSGVPVLAHPYFIRDDAVIHAMIASGVRGLEVYYPEHTQSMINFYLELCRTNDLLVTGGSDYHGKAKPDVKIGCIKIPYELVERLRSEAVRI